MKILVAGKRGKQMKEMYLNVEVESNENCDFLDVYYRNGMCFMCHKDDERLVEIEDAEAKGAEKMCKAIADICHSDDELVESAFDGYCTYAGIIGKFTPKEIIQRAEKLDVHVPAQGDIYVSRKSGNEVVVLSYNKETRRVRFMGGSYITNGSVEDFDNKFSFTWRGYADLESVVNELYSEEGDNT